MAKMPSVEKPSFYRKFNDALVFPNPDQISDLLLDALDSFHWSSENRAKLLQQLEVSLSVPSAP